jgi:hypothetical protein
MKSGYVEPMKCLGYRNQIKGMVAKGSMFSLALVVVNV